MLGTCECGNEPLSSIKCGEFLDYLKTSWLLKKDCVQWSKYISTRSGGWSTPCPGDFTVRKEMQYLL